ncbi:MAG: family N-acetyltransferase [Frankiales bacterium]|nr:family N-acetyltransferase [Frankiales bacterium]
MDSHIVLAGNVVRLEPLEAAQVGALVDAASEDRATYALTHAPGDAAGMTSYVDNALRERADGVSVPFVVRLVDTGRVVGTTRFLNLEYWPLPGGPDPRDMPSTAEIGATWLAASAQRTAVNTEAKFLLLTHAFEVWEVCRVSLQTDARNERSCAAIQRIGGQFEGVRRRHKLASDNTIRDSAFYSITDDEWPAVKVALTSRLARS